MTQALLLNNLRMLCLPGVSVRVQLDDAKQEDDPIRDAARARMEDDETILWMRLLFANAITFAKALIAYRTKSAMMMMPMAISITPPNLRCIYCFLKSAGFRSCFLNNSYK